jgi:general secretion pathway protein K
MPEQAPLLSMLAPEQIPLQSARSALAARPAGGWANITEFFGGTSLRGAVLPTGAQFQPQLRTRWFALDLDVAMDGAELHETALIDTRIAPARVAVRRWGSED